MRVSDVIVKTLEQLGVKVAFGIPGGTIATLANALSQSKLIQTILTQHECGAAYMALGYSSYTQGKNNEMGLCFGCSGPGVTNLITGVASAYEERIPIFVLTGNISTQFIGKGAAQDSFESGIHALQMYQSITAKTVILKSNENVVDIVKELYALAIKEKKPVHLNVPTDIAFMPALENEVHCFPHMDAQDEPNKEVIKEAIKAFLKAKRPLIFCGNGVKTSANKAPIAEMISKLAIPAINSSHAKGTFYEEQENYFGSFGFAANNRAKDFLTAYQPDAILFLGTRLGEVATAGWSALLDKAELKIHIDINEGCFNRNYKAQYAIKADIKTIIAAIEEEYIANKNAYKQYQNERQHLFNPFKKYASKVDPALFNKQGLIKPNELIQVLNELLPSNAFIFSDIGNSMAWLLQDLELQREQDFYVPVGLGAMGTSVCMSIGAKLAAGNRPMVCITGDCAVLMHGMELFTAKRAKLGVKYIILNDGGHGMVSHGDRLLGLKCKGVLFDAPLEFNKLGDLFGISTYSAKSLQEFCQLPLKAIFESQEPIILDLAIDRETVPPLSSRVSVLSHTTASQAAALIES